MYCPTSRVSCWDGQRDPYLTLVFPATSWHDGARQTDVVTADVLGVIVNPLARKTRAARARRELRRIIGQWGEVHETASVEDLRKAVEELYPRTTHLVSDGGDGSLNWLINEVEQCVTDPEDWPTFVPTNGGSVNAIARKARVRGRPQAILRALAAAAETDRPPPEVCLDTLALDGETADGAKFHRLCFGLAAGGVGNRFYEKYYGDHTHGRADVVRVIARSFGDYIANKVVRSSKLNYATSLFTPTQARVVIDGDEVPTRTHRLLHAGAIDLHIGAGFRLFPKAEKPGRAAFPSREPAALADRRALSSGAPQRQAPR